jgi:hypothetical protein
VTPTAITIIETNLPPPGGAVDFSPVYRFTPEGLAFGVPATLRIPSSNRSGPQPKTTIRWSGEDTCTLEPVADSYINAGFMQGSTRRLGYAMVAATYEDAARICH